VPNAGSWGTPVAEGVRSSRLVLELGQRYGIELPIVRWVCGALYEGRTAEEAYGGLRPAPRSEAEID